MYTYYIMNTYIFALQTGCYILWQMIRYCIGYSRLDCLKNTTIFLTNRNILYAKLFQTLATNAHILKIDEINFLSQFNDTAPYSEEDIYPIKEIIENVNVHFKSLNKSEIKLQRYVPTNSGIIALVYYGKKDDKEIVLKVKRRNIEEKLTNGINNFERMVRYCKWLPYINKLNIDVIFQENKIDLFRQLDFSNEVHVMETFKHKYRQTKYLSIPLVYSEYTSFNPDIIVMEKVTGHRLMEDDFRKDVELKSKFGYLLAKYSLRSILYDRIYHADLHAGNLFFNDDDPENLKICMIDFGITGEISKEYQNYFYLFFSNVLIEGKKMDAAQFCIDHFTIPKDKVVNMTIQDKKILSVELCDILNKIFETECQFDTQIIYLINNLLYNYGLTLNRNFCKLQLSLAVSSGIFNELCKGSTNYIDYIKLATKEIMDGSELFFDT